MQTLLQSSTARALVFVMYDSADHVTGKTGLTPTVVISKNGASFASPSGSVSEIGNGFYKVAGNATDTNTLGTLALSATASGADQATMAYNVVAYAQDDAVRLGLSALPNAAAEASGGLYTRGTGAGQINQPANGMLDANVVRNAGTAITSASGIQEVKVASIAANAITATSINADAITDAKVASDVTIASVTGAVGSVTGNVGGNVTGSVGSVVGAVGSVTAAVTVGTNNDKTGYGLSAAAVQAIWDALTSALTTVGSIGKWIVDKLDVVLSTRLASSSYTAPDNTSITAIKAKTDSLTFTVTGQVDSNVLDWKSATAPAMTGDAFARLGTPAGASVSADIAAVKAVDDAVKAKTDNLPSDPADESLIIGATNAIAALLGTPAGASIAADIAAIDAGSAPTAAEVADAVCDELLSGHAITGSVGAALSAASASGDPWATLVPGAYDDGTAGAALGRLNNTPADAPVLVIPDPADDASLCTVYVYTESLSNVKRAGIEITFRLPATPTKSERVLEDASVSMTTDEYGFAQITLQRTDLLTPSGQKYIVNCLALGIRDQEITLDAETFDLASLIA